jgi:class 3 adenylate cyclase
MTGRELFSLLERRRPAEGDALDRLIDRRCGEELAILVSDSAGFTRRTHEIGILPALTAVRRAYAQFKPIVAKHKGAVVSQKVDNLVAVYPDALRAVRSAVELRRAMRGQTIGFCLGIDVGRVIRLTDDVYGAPVNVASKLGEDLAGQDEILVTSEVARRVRGRIRVVYSRSTEIGGKEFELYKVR